VEFRQIVRDEREAKIRDVGWVNEVGAERADVGKV
jgi:hypothetical protein